MGHSVTVYEQRPRLGGMLRYGIPDYRLPLGVLDRDLSYILSAGIQVRTGVSIGTDIPVAQLQQQYDAVYIAIGAHSDKKLHLPGEEAQGVFSAVRLLRDIGEGRIPDFTGKRVCIIGGGNVSMDATRTAKRLGAASVQCIYRRRLEDMTALPEEIQDAMAEGCEIVTLEAPSRIETNEQGQVTALWTQPQHIGPYNGKDRPNPVKAALPERRFPCDVLIVAIGQSIVTQPLRRWGSPSVGAPSRRTCPAASRAGEPVCRRGCRLRSGHGNPGGGGRQGGSGQHRFLPGIPPPDFLRGGDSSGLFHPHPALRPGEPEAALHPGLCGRFPPGLGRDDAGRGPAGSQPLSAL
mgnify:CR=1 FL=1